jgi:DNA-binding transcriptional MerR regulator
MPDEPLLTLRELAARLELPESTVRYYRDAFLDYVPSVGTGRRRRYPPQAADVLRRIASGYAAGRSHREIAADLQQESPASVARLPVTPAESATARAMEDVTNLDLLAAILTASASSGTRCGRWPRRS